MTTILLPSRRRRRRSFEEEDDHSAPCTSRGQFAVDKSDSEEEDDEEERDIGKMTRNRPLCCSISDESTTMARRFGRTRRRSFLPFSPFSTILSLAVFGAVLLQPCCAITELRCGPIDIRNSPMGFRPLWTHVGDPNMVNHLHKKIVNCTVVEGSFTLSFISLPPGSTRKYKLEEFPQFPHLREITGSLLVFETKGLTTLNWIFPNLRVIGGQTLIQHYSLIIYRNHDLESLGLDKLSVIRNGGVRIMDNKLLCHTKTIDWKRMIISNVNDVVLDDAAEYSVTETGRLCPTGHCELDRTETKCRYLESGDERIQSCWNSTTCQKACQYDRGGPGCDPNGDRCHEECLGGCEVPNDATACHACRNLHYKAKCVPKCDENLYVLLDRRCVTKKACLELNPILANKTVPIKATNGICSDRCPHGYEQDPHDPKQCQKCVGECQVVCPGNYTIDTFPKALAIRRCNVIEGSLTIEMRGAMDSGMAGELNELFSSIHTIKGYLQVMRSPPFLTLHIFRNLKRIEGKYLYMNKYSLSVVENQNLRKLFDVNFTLDRGSLQFHNNRMLCSKQIKDLMSRLGRLAEMNENDQSSSSNGDKAICEDFRIEVNVTAISYDLIVLSWPAFNTTDMDHRKFLGYEIFYKEVEKIDEHMSIDDDRSACVDSWSSVFVQHKERDEGNEETVVSTSLSTDQRIKPHTIYAYYVATQMVHHAGAKNGISKIGFVTTEFYTPDPPMVQVSKVTSEAIELSWEAPLRPNGVITHYQITWREIDVDTLLEAEGFCADDNTRAITTTYTQAIDRDDDLLVVPGGHTTSAPSLTSLMGGGQGGTCSAIVGCCSCAAGKKALASEADSTDELADFENSLLNEIITPKEKVRRRRAINSASRLSIEKDQENGLATTIVTTVAPVTVTTTVFPNHQDEKKIVAGRWTKNVTAKAGANLYTIQGLRHYTTYSITISACQNVSVEKNYCSHGFKAAKRKRTKALLNIDRVANETIRAQFLNDSLHITWDAVAESNGGITGYMVQMVGLDGRTPPQACVAAKKNWNPEKIGTLFKGLADGQYRVQITAYSLYRNGEPSIRWKPITVFTPGFWTMERIGVLILAVLVLIALVLLFVYYYIRKYYGKKVKAMADFMQSNPEYCVDTVYKQDDWELNLADLTIGGQCGEGSFGKVYLGTGNNIESLCGVTFGPCAIKINHDDPSSAENLNYLMEASIMKNFNTSFIVKLYGVVSTVNPAHVVMEVMELGNLRDYLRSKRDEEEFNEQETDFYGAITKEQFHEWGAQIADGMAYLESLKFCHRDLAARNCMINADETVKIGDFGMARDLFYHDYYKPSGKRLMPVRWMAPESLKDGKFDSKSDAWSYGVVLYEMMTLGAQPYIGLSNEEVLNYIGMARKVIKRPDTCPDYWYKIMKMCWRYVPRDRPTFAQLVHLMAQNAPDRFREASFVLNNNQLALEDSEELDLDQFEYEEEEERRNTDSIPMDVLKLGNSQSTLSVNDGNEDRPLLSGKPANRQASLDDEYALMNHSRGPSDTEVRNYSSGDGDYVERDVQNDVPTRRNTGASSSSYGTHAYCLANRGSSNERAGFGEGVRLTDAVGSGQLDEGDYVEKDLSMDTRRSTGASTSSYGIPQTNWSSNRGATYYAERAAAAARNGGRGDKLTQLPGTQKPAPGGDYVETDHTKNGSPSRNGNFCGRGGFSSQHDRLPEDTEHPLA